jgi:glycosyltransferase involved in cell wall biosynthesis
MGLPSIVTDINGCNEIIIDNENGLIIPVKNASALQLAMQKIVEHTEFYESLKKNARKRIVETYEQKVVWEAILAEYLSIENNV